MSIVLLLRNLRLVGYAVLIALVIWFYKDYAYQRAENVRQTENARQLRLADSLKYTEQILKLSELKDYLAYQNPDLKKKLEADKIKLARIESIISQTLHYKDSAATTQDLAELLKAIKGKTPSRTTFTDSTACLTNKGYLEYVNDSLKIVFTSREFKNKADAVVYWQRRQWTFLGFKTRFLGKKEVISKTYSPCGDIKTTKIEKLKE